ncbi:MAG: hypothetical protein ACLP7Q_24255 [Isosphaeraceae bacterium]
MRTNSRVLKATGGKFGYLLVALVALLVTAPAITESMVLRVAIALLATSVFVTGLYAARPRRRSVLVGLILAGIDFGIGRLAAFDGARWLVLLQAVFWLATMTYVTVTILEVVLASQPVTMETLQAAFCVFLLLGLAWHVLMCSSDWWRPARSCSMAGLIPRWCRMTRGGRVFSGS